jgi:nitroreductase
MPDPTATTPLDRVRPLLRTRQVREFTDEPPTRDELAALADVARWTGSAGNSQPWRFVVIRDREALRRLAEAGLPQTRLLRTASAAIAIVLTAGDRDLVDAYDDGRVAERVLVGAGMLGLAAGIGWIRDDVRPAVGKILGLPADRYVRTIIGLGHPSEAAQRPKSAPGEARLPRHEVVFEDRWPG